MRLRLFVAIRMDYGLSFARHIILKRAECATRRTTGSIMPQDTQIRLCLGLWDVPSGAAVRLINVSENDTYLVEAPGGFRSVLRVHRKDYHSRRAIECELAWAQALRVDRAVKTPAAIAGRDGNLIQSADLGPSGLRHMVMFEFVPGREPQPDEDLVVLFHHLGETAARTHLHSLNWIRPDPFERLIWDEDAVFGPAPIWGSWRQGPNVGRSELEVLSRLETTLLARLAAFGKARDRYGLIHADMRLANLLIDGDSTTVIDFDDCGFGWFLYDFAAAISFMEDHPQVPDLKEAWVSGYRSIRDLSDAEFAEIDTFVMLRRMALLGWMGTHQGVDVVTELSPDFAANTAGLAERYLGRMSLAP